MGNSMGGFKEYLDMVRKYPQYQGGFIWDFVDQGLRYKNKVPGKQIYAYGGDYGCFPKFDEDSSNNGLVGKNITDNQYNTYWGSKKTKGASIDSALQRRRHHAKGHQSQDERASIV